MVIGLSQTHDFNCFCLLQHMWLLTHAAIDTAFKNKVSTALQSYFSKVTVLLGLRGHAQRASRAYQ